MLAKHIINNWGKKCKHISWIRWRKLSSLMVSQFSSYLSYCLKNNTLIYFPCLLPGSSAGEDADFLSASLAFAFENNNSVMYVLQPSSQRGIRLKRYMTFDFKVIIRFECRLFSADLAAVTFWNPFKNNSLTVSWLLFVGWQYKFRFYLPKIMIPEVNKIPPFGIFQQ